MKLSKNIFLASAMQVMLMMACLVVASPGFAQSLFNEKTYQSYVSDKKAFKVGDTLTVLVYEISSAETTADTNAHRSSEFSADINDLNSTNIDVGDVEFGIASNGGGKVKRAGNLKAQLSVNVVSVLENGILEISGEQMIVVNDEEQRIVVRGKVRPEDVSTENTVVSSRLSDARIEYLGKGVLGDSQEPGWIYKFMNWLGVI